MDCFPHKTLEDFLPGPFGDIVDKLKTSAAEHRRKRGSPGTECKMNVNMEGSLVRGKAENTLGMS